MKRNVFLILALIAFMAAVLPTPVHAQTIPEKRVAPGLIPRPKQQTAAELATEAGYDVEQLSKQILGVPASQVTVFYISYSSNAWDDARAAVRSGPDNAKYLFIINGSFELPGLLSTGDDAGYSFNTKVISSLQTNPNLFVPYIYKPATIGITGKGTISLSSKGSWLFVCGQTVIIDGELTLEGYKDNTAPLINISQEFGTRTKVELRNGILRGNASSAGGAVLILSGEFVMSGGTITGNSAPTGGGVFLSSSPDGGAFTMSGGTITGNSASAGAGVFIYGGKFNMNGGTISGNTAARSIKKSDSQTRTYHGGLNGYGGGLFMESGYFTMTGGTISGNKAVRGGGAYLWSVWYFEKSGGIIYGNNEKKASDRNTAADGKTWGHAVFHEIWATPPRKPEKFIGNYYRDTTLDEKETMKLENLWIDFDKGIFNTDLLPAAKGKSKNGWTMR